MNPVGELARTASLIGDPARAAILVSLMDGRALTAGELARAAGVTAPTASEHLGRLLDAGMIALQRQGRHRYFRIADPSVAGLIETLMSVSGELRGAANTARRIRTGPTDRALRRARLCYDHLAGEAAVAIAQRLAAEGHVLLSEDGGSVTGKGRTFLASIGVELPVEAPEGEGATFCRPCLDWSERRLHLGGRFGRSIYDSFVRLQWLRPPGTGRSVAITRHGVEALERHFGIRPLQPPELL